MSNKPFFLLTGDDSVRGEGIILVKRLVQDWADYQIVATKAQMSGVGSKITLPGGTYGTEIVDGHEAIWVDGTPADAVNLATTYLNRPIDMVISGMNLGQNITNEMHRSGTVGAAVTAVQSRGLKAIAISREVPPEQFFMNHTGSFNDELLEYPGKMLKRLIELAHHTTFDPYTFWNINFPNQPSEKISVAPTSSGHYWINEVRATKGAYSYVDDVELEPKPGEDVYELTHGAITITPCKVEYTDYTKIDSLKTLLRQESLIP